MEKSEKMESKKLSKQFLNKMKEIDQILYDPKMSTEQKLSKIYEKSLRAVKECGNLKKHFIRVEKEIDVVKQGINSDFVTFTKQNKQKNTLVGLFEDLKKKNVEAHKEHDLAIQKEQDSKTEMSANF